MLDSVESVTPDRGRHYYSLLLQDKAFLNGEFLAEVPELVECSGEFLSQGEGHPLCITSRSLLNAGSLNLSLRIC